jgi:hypothetical protein
VTSRLLRPLRICGIAALALAAITCRDHPSGDLGLPFPAALAVAPGVSSVIGGPVFDLVSVRITLSDFPANTLVLDTVALFTPGDSTLSLAVAVQLMRPTQAFYLRVAAVDPLGDTLFRSLDTVTLRQNESAPRPASVVLQYSGPDTLVAAVSLAPRDTTIPIGLPLTMRPVALGMDQSVLKAVRFGWRSSNPANIAVSPDGTVIALASTQGVWIIATTANGRTDSTQISASLPAQSLRVTPDTASIGIDATLPLSVVAVDALGSELPLTEPVLWSSEDSRIAGVSTTGQVAGLTPGTTRIIAIAGTIKGEMRVTVVQPATTIASIAIDSVFVSLLPGDSLLLRATPRDAQGLPVSYPITWSALDTILGVDSRGMVTARVAGTGRIAATADKASDTVTVTVLDPQVTDSTGVIRAP